MNVRNVIKFIDLVSFGITEATCIDARQTFRVAVMKNVKNIIIAHNHPYGYASPSEADSKITKKFKKGGEILDINLLDSLIITNDTVNYYSFCDEGVL